MKHKVILCFILFYGMSAVCQIQKIDSLENVLKIEELSSYEELIIYETISQFYLRNDLEKGFEYALKGLELAQIAKNKRYECAFYRNLGVVYFYKSSYDTARIYTEKALFMANELGNDTLVSTLYVDMGNLYAYFDYEKALEYYIKSLLAESEPDKGTAVVLNNIGSIHRVLKNFDRAISYHEQALEIAEKFKSEDYKMRAYNGLGVAYADKGDIDIGIKYLQESLSINENVGHTFYGLSSMIALSALLCQKNEYDQALNYCHKALQIAEETESPREIRHVLMVLSDIYCEMGNYKECERLAMRSWATDSITHDVAGATAKTLTVAYIHLGEKDKAEYFFRKYYHLSAEANSKSLHQSLTEMEVKYETEKKELRIDSLEKERQLYIWLAVAGALLIFAMGIVLRQKIKNEQKKRQLAATNAVQDGEMGERERLATELHDRLGGTLSAVKSELNGTQNILSISNKLDECIEEVRRITHNMMPLSLRFGINAALEDFAAQFTNVNFHFFGKERHIDKRLEFVIYCCANELVTNSLRHSGAENVNVQLIQEENRIALIVEDNGCGLNKATIKQGIGLKSIYDRVASCNGKIEIISSIGKGTETCIEFKS